MLNLKDPSLLKTGAFISGEWVTDVSNGVFGVSDPASGLCIATVSDAGVLEARLAIDAAVNAFVLWSAKTAKERSALLKVWFRLIMENQEDLAQILTAEQGKPIAEARSEVAYGASFIEWFAEEAKRIYGDVIPSPVAGRQTIVTKQPIGVVAAITPWNFPIAMITRKVAPALAAGCSIVIKPAAETPLSALALAELAKRAGVPAGLINIVPGQDAVGIGGELTSHPNVRKLSFTGSTRVGKLLMAQCASTVKRTSMELGGNAPFIIFDDADINAAIEGVLASKYRNAGQTCVCANRILVQHNIYGVFAEKLADAVAALKLGCGAEESNSVGPLISNTAAGNAAALVADAVSKGAKLLIGGEVSRLGTAFYEPTVLVDVDTSMRVFTEEIFAPIAPLFQFETEAEAIALANDTPYGLASYIYTRDQGRSWRVSEALDYGMVGVNEGVISSEVAPFGGMKESGQGREGSRYGLDDYLEIKYICMGGLAV